MINPLTFYPFLSGKKLIFYQLDPSLALCVLVKKNTISTYVYNRNHPNNYSTIIESAVSQKW